MKKTKIQQSGVNNALLNIITPIGLELKRNSLIIGENTGRVYGIIKYPQKVDYGWLAKITNIPGTIVGITFIPIDNGEFISGLSRNVIQHRSAAETAKDPLTQQRAERAAIDGEKIMLQIDQLGETVGTMIISIMTVAREESNFNRICRKGESVIATSKCKTRIMANLQEQAFKSVSPYYTLYEAISEVLKRIIPMSSFVGGFPFSSSGYNDGTGYYFGRDNAGGLVVLDPWKRGNDRTNTNFTIMGVAGVGKSTVVKHIALSEYMKGTKIIFIDPESEYKELTKALDGDWINAGGGSNYKINPLQIRTTPVDDDDKFYKDEGNGMGDMAIYIKNLEIFFSLYLTSLTDKQKAILKNEIIELYHDFGITWDTDIKKLSNDDFPIFSDLYDLIKKKADEAKKNKGISSTNEYADLALLLQDLALGSDAFLWNGKSTIKTNTRCICLDTHDLQNTSDNIKRTQYFNLLTWCWQQMSADRSEPVLLICDEAYLMIDPNVPQSLVFLRNVEKRARKYSGIAIISHSVEDFLDPKIKMYGQALLDIPCFKILMGCDGKNLIETKELYNLTDAEEQLLSQKKRENALVMIGSKCLHVNFEIHEYKFKFMGTAGGR